MAIKVRALSDGWLVNRVQVRLPFHSPSLMHPGSPRPSEDVSLAKACYREGIQKICRGKPGSCFHESSPTGSTQFLSNKYSAFRVTC